LSPGLPRVAGGRGQAAEGRAGFQKRHRVSHVSRIVKHWKIEVMISAFRQTIHLVPGLCNGFGQPA
jgi:hypothetical protein